MNMGFELYIFFSRDWSPVPLVIIPQETEMYIMKQCNKSEHICVIFSAIEWSISIQV